MDYSRRSIKKVLSHLKDGRISRGAAFKKFEHFPFHDMGFAKIDFHRAIRKGFPEVIFAPGKKDRDIAEIAKRIIASGNTLLITKASPELYGYLRISIPVLKFNEDARMIYYARKRPRLKKSEVLIVTAGTSDIPVAEEAVLTLELLGNRVGKLYDVGVAGIHRVVGNIPLLKKAKVIIVVAGMEGALASIVGGLVACPVIAVPTSVGYGASFGGLSSLLTMLNSCAPGVCVMNIDNGFGAGYFAGLINK
ncbi:MAG: nickel pincer cofactor biosynthesis protein LarB [Candidatus Omnitrophica bacterium]|nr:nickel pincer cofactor biosynthesis protein LarB [Candidatus Omnitrophota bacterium]MDD5310757.1 nickel pincer cofactor biosynthesis protein LarB [Candidatus Omnitrophota bacterium]MDD5545560.1 nickel pincer cofactor biosynthesis protein LarB [Candidatus Omnitrophota bacterium]